jgi:hypothetical protein
MVAPCTSSQAKSVRSVRTDIGVPFFTVVRGRMSTPSLSWDTIGIRREVIEHGN